MLFFLFFLLFKLDNLLLLVKGRPVATQGQELPVSCGGSYVQSSIVLVLYRVLVLGIPTFSWAIPL